MAFTFQLMLVYTLLDPLLVISSMLTTALGEPQVLTKVKLVQMFFFVPAVVMLAHFLGINGVAVAADLMLALGIVSILPRVKRYVDFSMWRMLGYPALGLTLALPTVLLVQTQLHDLHIIFALLFKAIVATVIYGTVLFVFEREQLFSVVRLVSSLLMRRTPAWIE
jgi:O-antigen/teichoic acid export membrane protein